VSLRERWHAAWWRVRALVRRAQLERDMDEEMRFHLAMREADHAASTGEDAARSARRRFGNVAALQEECRDVWTFAALETLRQDTRFALRVLWRSPGLTAAAAASLALGIGANTAMFSLVSAILLRPLPYPDADRLVRLKGFYPKGAVVALQEEARTMEAAGALADVEMNLTGQGEAVRLAGSVVSANLFAVLGRGAALGRTLEPGDDRPGRDGVVVLSHSVWQARFGGDASVVGRVVAIDGVGRQVVGVMPPGFHFPSATVQLWVPLRLDPGQSEDYWGFGWMPAVARLRGGASVAQAHDELRSMVVRIGTMFPWPAPDWNADAAVVPLQEDLVRDVRRTLLVLQAAVGMVLLIACANVASLLLSRAAVRRKEMALRAALGATRSRLLRQLLTESVALSVLGGALGVALALAALRALAAVLPAEAGGFAAVGVDGGVLAFVTLLSLLCGLLFGLAPAAAVSGVDLAGSIKSGGQRATATHGVRLRGAFIAAEVALAVVLTVGAGLLIRTLHRLMRVDPGFRPGQVQALRVSPNPEACDARAECVALYDELLRRVQALPGVAAVAAASTLPMSGDQPLLPVEMEGHRLDPAAGRAPLLWAGAVTPDYFDLLHVPLLQGRAFDRADAERAAPVVVVSAGTARRYWPGQDPIGKRIRVVWDADWRTVVGVVGDVRQYALSGRSPADITGALYMPYPQAVALDRQIPRSMALVVRSSGDPDGLGEGLRASVAGMSPDLPVSAVERLDVVVAASVAEARAMMWLFAGFAGCALFLAAIGTYGVVSYATAQRTYEIGVRVAVGASRRDILGLVVGQSLKLVLAGLAAGVVAALALGRTLSSFLYGVTASDPVTFAAVTGILVLTAVLAGALPGRRAAAIDPARALRND
jgi:putative ABC transport system permease protein